MSIVRGWIDRARRLRADILAVHLAAVHPGVPWYARAVGVAVAAYALSPIDLIPDVIPVLGHLDDLLLVPLGVALFIRLIPGEVWAECRERAASGERGGGSPQGAVAAAVVVLIWVGVAIWITRLIVRGSAGGR